MLLASHLDLVPLLLWELDLEPHHPLAVALASLLHHLDSRQGYLVQVPVHLKPLLDQQLEHRMLLPPLVELHKEEGDLQPLLQQVEGALAAWQAPLAQALVRRQCQRVMPPCGSPGSDGELEDEE